MYIDSIYKSFYLSNAYVCRQKFILIVVLSRILSKIIVFQDIKNLLKCKTKFTIKNTINSM